MNSMTHLKPTSSTGLSLANPAKSDADKNPSIGTICHLEPISILSNTAQNKAIKISSDDKTALVNSETDILIGSKKIYDRISICYLSLDIEVYIVRSKTPEHSKRHLDFIGYCITHNIGQVTEALAHTGANRLDLNIRFVISRQYRMIKIIYTPLSYLLRATTDHESQETTSKIIIKILTQQNHSLDLSKPNPSGSSLLSQAMQAKNIRGVYTEDIIIQNNTMNRKPMHNRCKITELILQKRLQAENDSLVYEVSLEKTRALHTLCVHNTDCQIASLLFKESPQPNLMLKHSYNHPKNKTETGSIFHLIICKCIVSCKCTANCQCTVKQATKKRIDRLNKVFFVLLDQVNKENKEALLMLNSQGMNILDYTKQVIKHDTKKALAIENKIKEFYSDNYSDSIDQFTDDKSEPLSIKTDPQLIEHSEFNELHIHMLLERMHEWKTGKPKSIPFHQLPQTRSTSTHTTSNHLEGMASCMNPNEIMVSGGFLSNQTIDLNKDTSLISDRYLSEYSIKSNDDSVPNMIEQSDTPNPNHPRKRSYSPSSDDEDSAAKKYKKNSSQAPNEETRQPLELDINWSELGFITDVFDII